METVNVDHIWRTLGPLGKYQWKQTFSYLLSLIAWLFQGINIVFIGHRPGFHCKPSTNDTLANNFTDVRKEYKECEIVTFQNTSDGIIKTSSSCAYGWDYDASADQSFVTEWDLVCEHEELAELTQVFYIVGMMIGTLVFPTLSDRFGRKPVMVISHVILFGVSLGLSFSANYTVFVVLRLLAGFFVQGLLAGTTLALETLPAEIRHYVQIAVLLVWTTFGCLVAPIAYALRNYPWKYLQITYAMLSAWSVFQWWMTDESLRWVLANGQIERAKTIIKNACKWNNKNYTDVSEKLGFDEFRSFELMLHPESKNKGSVQNSRTVVDPLVYKNSDSEKIRTHCDGKVAELTKGDLGVRRYTMFDIFKHKPILVVSMIMWYTWICDSLVYFGLYMMTSNMYGNRYITFFLCAVIEYISCLLEYLCLARIGRKWTCIIGHLIAAVGLAVATALTYTAEGNSIMLAAATVFTLIGKLGATTAYNTAYLVTAELYPTNMRNIGIGVCSFMEKVGLMIAPFSRNVSMRVRWLPACVFAIMCLITVVLFGFVPETNGVELPTTIEELREWYHVNKFDLKIGKNKYITNKKSDITVRKN